MLMWYHDLVNVLGSVPTISVLQKENVLFHFYDFISLFMLGSCSTLI